MENNNYHFKEQFEDKDQSDCVTLCQKAASKEGKILVDVSKIPKYYDRKNPEYGADLKGIIHGKVRTIDVKCCKRIGNNPNYPPTEKKHFGTGNLAVEMVEKLSRSIEYTKEGWIYLNVDYIYYVNWWGRINYIFNLKELRDFVFTREWRQFETPHLDEPSLDRNYFTTGFLVPLTEVEHLYTIQHI